MTLPQIWNALNEGEPLPEPGVREFGSPEEAAQWRLEMRHAFEARQAQEHRQAVAAWRKTRKGS